MNTPPTHPESSAAKDEFSRVFRMMLPDWRTSSKLVAAIAVGAGFSLVPPLMIRQIIDRALPEKNHALLTILTAAAVTTALIGGLAGVWRNYLSTIAGQRVVFDLRCRIYERLLKQPPHFFKKTRVGEIISRLQVDIGDIHDVVSDTLIAACFNLILASATLCVLFVLDWRLALVAAVVVPVFVFPARKVGRERTRISGRTQETIAEMSSIVEETLSLGGAMLVRIFGARSKAADNFASTAQKLRELTVRSSIVGRWFLMWVLLFVTVGPVIIYYFGGQAAISQRISVGTVVAFVAYLGQLYVPISALASVHIELMSALALFRRIFEYIDLPDHDATIAARHKLSGCGPLKFSNVSFQFERGNKAVENVSFEALPGKMVALVGPSGAGKSTVAFLASGIYTPSEGEVTLDGIDLRSLSAAQTSETICMITQETTLFNTTIEENLRYACPDASHDELIRACKLAQIHDAISLLPFGYSTEIGERGHMLSGGERQRLSIARALLRNARILVLDEATASLDSRHEESIHTALDAALSGRTSLVIAHRMSTILRADLILVFDHGHIVERGTHTQLLAKNGLYSSLFHTQFGRL